MAGISITFEGRRFGVDIERNANETLSMLARGISGGAREAGADIERRGRLNIQSSGRFGVRWWGGFHVDVEPKTGALLNATIELSHSLWFAHIHEFGGVIKGQPLLWIPLSFADDAKGIWARDYNKLEGGLFRVDRAGKKPLLLSIRDKQPKYVGVAEVTIPKRWNLMGISRSVMSNFVVYYMKHRV